jgi:hypothetical protein
MLKTVSSIANAIGALNYKGTWNASTNTPALASGVGTKGDYYVVSVAGTTALDGIGNWGVGDWATFNGSVWQRVEGGADLNGVNLTVTGTGTIGGLSMSGTTLTSTGDVTVNLNLAATEKVRAGYTTGSGRPAAELYSVGASQDMILRVNDLLRVYNATGDMKFYVDHLNSRVGCGYTTIPSTNNTFSLGSGSNLWTEVFAANGTINTSDERAKTEIREVSEAERKVAQKCKSLLRAFKWKDSVEKKGASARIHFGVIAQDVKAAFESEGLDAHAYGLFCYDEWQDQFEDVLRPVEVQNDKGETVIVMEKTGKQIQTQVAGNRYGVRYEQLLAFIISAI